MKINTTLLCFFVVVFFNTYTQAQRTSNGNNTTLKAQILHQETKAPIAFVNVGFIGKGIGSVTDAQGYFELTYPTHKIKGSDIIQFSIIGFKTKQIPIASIESLLSNRNTLTLVPELYDLEEVVLENTKIKNTTIGNSKINPEKFGYWKNELGLGGEIASKIKIKRKQTQLQSLNFMVLENLSDSIRIRVNVYDIDPVFRTPKNNLLNTTIYHTVSKRSGIERIPLSKYKIFTDTDVIVSIELIEIYGERLGFAVAGSANKNPSFTRSISQDYWKPHKAEAMGFTMDVSYPLKKGDKETIDRVRPEAITIFWDASAKGKLRDLDAEFELIDRYIKALKNAEVTVQKFAFKYVDSKTFQVKKGKSEAVLDYLNETIYEGVPDYASLKEFPSQKTQSHLIFTNGNTLFSDLTPVFNNPTFTISTNKKTNTEVLEEVALYTDGVYIDLNRHTPKKALIYLLEDIPVENSDEENDVTISKIKGKITSEFGPLQGAAIKVKNTFKEQQSDAKGRFEILAEQGDVLIVRFPTMEINEIQVTDTQMDIVMKVDGNLLEEVVLRGKKEEELVKTASGKKNFDAVSFKTNIITEEDISPSHLTLGDVLTRVSGIRVNRNVFTGEEEYVNPRAGSITLKVLPIVVLDGVPYDQASVPFINPQNMASVQVITSIHAVTLYGTLGRGGAIIVTTKTGDPDYYASKKEKKPSLLIQGNDYDGEAVVTLDEDINKPVYLIQLERTTTIEQAERTYQMYKNTILDDPIVFYTDVASYFKKWDKNIALRILSNLSEVAPDNIEVLKLLAYHLESFEEEELANKVYRKIFDLAPSKIQSYRDLALSYQQIGDYKKAFELYKQILVNETEGLDFTPLKKTAEFELMRLVAFHKSKINFTDLPNELLNVGFKKDRRLVFEWTDPQAAFEIQFVNPQGKYFKWEHSVFSNQERLKDEVIKGYSLEEFALDDAPPGEWLINIQYLGEDNIQPPIYLKYTLYLNYATPQETKEVKIIKLFQQKEKTTLGTLTLR
ncbi:carboxypeptidase-like regulatory domain-containing protein [Dokdonia sp.]|uniref:carboxypeptidase-like regulatory domain-containing protein n=1 Tax=Dokdonia sp. TaxID=2024995 RepID=UPI003265334E